MPPYRKVLGKWVAAVAKSSGGSNTCRTLAKRLPPWPFRGGGTTRQATESKRRRVVRGRGVNVEDDLQAKLAVSQIATNNYVSI